MLETDIVSHEFGHGFAYYTLGEIYTGFSDSYAENWAIYHTNHIYREFNSRPIQPLDGTFWSSIWGIGWNPPNKNNKRK